MKYIDLTGQRVGTIVVKSASTEKRYGSTQKFWNCQCDCGKELILPGQALRKGNVTCRDCYTPNSRLIGCAINVPFADYRNGADKRNLEFNLTPEQFKEIVNKDCHYCGAKPSNVWKAWSESCTINGIDRVDNVIGYNFDNCVPCCKICNRAKRELSYTEFIAWLKQAGEHARNL